MTQELWQIAKPFGRPRRFKTAQELWGAFLAYVEWSANNPMTINDTKSQRRTTLKEEKSQYKQTVERPLTIGAFRLHAGIKREWCIFKEDYSEKSQDFCRVLQAIESTIRNQQVQNAMVGNYKENLVARINSISDSIKQDVHADVKSRTSLSVGEAQAFLEELEKTI